MKAFFGILAGCALVEGVRHSRKGCTDPVKAIMTATECLENEDYQCADEYGWQGDYEKIHNGKQVARSSIKLEVADFNFVYKIFQNIGPNKAEIRYQEVINFKDGETDQIVQHEHAFVDVDDECKITKWDQYGDNQEQKLEHDAFAARAGTPALLALADGSNKKPCADPVAAIMKTMNCLEAKDSKCVNDGYNWKRFDKLHNGKNIGLHLLPFDVYWSMATKFSTFDLVYDHAENIGTNFASVRYKEIVDMSNGTEFGLEPSNVYPFGHHAVQYEHALVKVDNDCKMTEWDQYGDDAEQADVDDALEVMLKDCRIKKVLKIPSLGQCK